jgi:hypothetical protein
MSCAPIPRPRRSSFHEHVLDDDDVGLDLDQAEGADDPPVARDEAHSLVEVVVIRVVRLEELLEIGSVVPADPSNEHRTS